MGTEMYFVCMKGKFESGNDEMSGMSGT